MTSRERILAKVRAGVAAGSPVTQTVESDTEREATVARRLSAPERHLIPARVAGKPAAELPGILKQWLELAGGEMIEAAGPPDVPAAIAGYLRRHNLPQRVRTGADPRLTALPWSREPQLEIAHGRFAGFALGAAHHALSALETRDLRPESGTLAALLGQLQRVARGLSDELTLKFFSHTVSRSVLAVAG